MSRSAQIAILLCVVLLGALLIPSKKLLSRKASLQQFSVSIAPGLIKRKAIHPSASVGSGLAYLGKDENGILEFWAVTDRGPNLAGPRFVDKEGREMSSRVFLEPDFAPKLVKLQLRDSKAEVTSVLPLRNRAGEGFTGITLRDGFERALDGEFQALGSASLALDPEGVAIDPNGGFWIVSEHGPGLLRVSAKDGVVLKRHLAGAGLPSILRRMSANKGFEGVTVTPRGIVYAVMQATLDLDRARSASRGLIRLVRFDPITAKTAMFAYPIDEVDQISDIRLKGLSVIDEDRLLTLEQGKRDGEPYSELVLITVGEATDLSRKKIDGRYPEEFLVSHSWEKLRREGILPLTRKGIFDLGEVGLIEQKLEGLALMEDNQTVFLIDDTDFGVNLSVHLRPQDVRMYESGDFDLGDLTLADIFEVSQGGDRKTSFWILRLPRPVVARGLGGSLTLLAVLALLAVSLLFAFKRLRD